jgi:hypothetical protein
MVRPFEWNDVQTAFFAKTSLPSFAVNLIENSVPAGSTSLFICEMCSIAFFYGQCSKRGKHGKGHINE